MPAAAPPVPTPPIRSPLPAPLTALIGRAHEVAATIDLLHRPDVRLVTLTGLGGSGKTRLSIHVASDLQAVFADGVMFVPLAAITDPDLVIPSIARHLDIPHDQHDAPLAAIQARLHDRHLLLVLDNLEHVVAAAPMVVQILTAAPRVKILATSRILLHVSGEHIVRIPPLSSPALEVLPDPAAILTYDAVRLFIARAQAVYPELTLTATTLAAIAEICTHLDGLPLSIELAAVRSSQFTPQEILAAMAHRGQFLTDGPRDLPARQQTLYATLDWSYAVLEPTLRRFYTALGCFVGGWTADAAASIGKTVLVTESRAALRTLLAANLIHRIDSDPQGGRFRMLETIREYALHRLDDAGDGLAIRRCHATYYRDLAETVAVRLAVAVHPDDIALLEADHDNVRAALTWSAEHDPLLALRLAAALWRFWMLRGYYREGHTWLERLLPAAPDAPISVRITALQGVGMLASAINPATPVRARAMEQALALARQLGDDHSIGVALNFCALAAFDGGDMEQAMEFHLAALALRRARGDSAGIAATTNNLALIAMRQGNQRAAIAYYQEALTHFRLDSGNLDAALILLRESLVLRRAFGDSRWLPTSLNLIAVIALRQGHLGTARDLLDESLTHCRQFVDQHAMVKHTLEVLAHATAATDARVWTAEIHGAIAQLDQIVPREPWYQPAYAQQLAADQARLDPLSWQLAWDKGYARETAAMLVVASEFCHRLTGRHMVTPMPAPHPDQSQHPVSTPSSSHAH